MKRGIGVAVVIVLGLFFIFTYFGIGNSTQITGEVVALSESPLNVLSIVKIDKEFRTDVCYPKGLRPYDYDNAKDENGELIHFKAMNTIPNSDYTQMGMFHANDFSNTCDGVPSAVDHYDRGLKGAGWMGLYSKDGSAEFVEDGCSEGYEWQANVWTDDVEGRDGDPSVLEPDYLGFCVKDAKAKLIIDEDDCNLITEITCEDLDGDYVAAGRFHVGKFSDCSVEGEQTAGQYKYISGSTTHVRKTDSGWMTLCTKKGTVISDSVEGLISHYKFENNVVDEKGRNSVTLTEGDIGYFSGKDGGKSASFLNKDFSIVINDFTSLPSDEMSLAFWMNAKDYEDYENIISHEWNTGWSMYLGQYGKMRFGISEGSGDNLVKNVILTKSISADEWHHVAGTYDGQDMKVYVDGRLQSTKEVEGLSIDNIGPVKIGDVNFDGMLDDLIIYDVALTAEDIAVLADVTVEEITEEEITKMYWYVVDREPDAVGLTHWKEVIGSGAQTLDNLAHGLFLEYYKKANGDLTKRSDGHFVNTLYYVLLKRTKTSTIPADQKDFYIIPLGLGDVTRKEVIDMFIASPEFDTKFARFVIPEDVVCSDTDVEVDYYLKGTASVAGGSSATDLCAKDDPASGVSSEFGENEMVLLSNRATCDVDNPCVTADYICIEGFCAHYTDQCRGNLACDEDQTCRDKICEVYPSCDSDAVCGNGRECVGDVCVKPDMVCSDEVSCPSGKECVGGTCEDTPECSAEVVCGTGETCTAGVCVALEVESNDLYEYSCDGSAIKTEIVTCPNGCSEGACIQLVDRDSALCPVDSEKGIANELAPRTRVKFGTKIFYCDPLSLDYAETSPVNADCVSDYQCKSNACVEEECTNIRGDIERQGNLIRNIWCAISNMGSFFDRDDAGVNPANNDFVGCATVETESKIYEGNCADGFDIYVHEVGAFAVGDYNGEQPDDATNENYINGWRWIHFNEDDLGYHHIEVEDLDTLRFLKTNTLISIAYFNWDSSIGDYDRSGTALHEMLEGADNTKAMCNRV